jgi:hypothetical protein
MNDEREPASRPGDEPAGGGSADDSWIIIDDAAVEPPARPTGAGFDAPSGTVPFEQQDVTPRNPPQSTPQSHGWDSFTNTETWNGMQISPPGSTPGAGGGEPVGRPEAGTAPQAPAASGWGARADDTGQDRFGQTMTMEGTWFVDGDGDDGDLDDGLPETARTPWVDRLPQVDGLALRPSLVTFTVICMGALLVVSSIIWHPHAP